MAAVGYLVHINDPNDCHELLNADISIGRSDDNDVVLPDKSVSSKHAKIVFDTHRGSNRITLSDVGSRNATFVNRERLQPGSSQPIKFGDTLRFGYDPSTYRLLQQLPELRIDVEDSEAPSDLQYSRPAGKVNPPSLHTTDLDRFPQVGSSRSPPRRPKPPRHGALEEALPPRVGNDDSVRRSASAGRHNAHEPVDIGLAVDNTAPSRAARESRRDERRMSSDDNVRASNDVGVAHGRRGRAYGGEGAGGFEDAHPRAQEAHGAGAYGGGGGGGRADEGGNAGWEAYPQAGGATGQARMQMAQGGVGGATGVGWAQGGQEGMLEDSLPLPPSARDGQALAAGLAEQERLFAEEREKKRADLALELGAVGGGGALPAEESGDTKLLRAQVAALVKELSGKERVLDELTGGDDMARTLLDAQEANRGLRKRLTERGEEIERLQRRLESLASGGADAWKRTVDEAVAENRRLHQQLGHLKKNQETADRRWVEQQDQSASYAARVHELETLLARQRDAAEEEGLARDAEIRAMNKRMQEIAGSSDPSKMEAARFLVEQVSEQERAMRVQKDHAMQLEARMKELKAENELLRNTLSGLGAEDAGAEVGGAWRPDAIKFLQSQLWELRAQGAVEHVVRLEEKVAQLEEEAQTREGVVDELRAATALTRAGQEPGADAAALEEQLHDKDARVRALEGEAAQLRAEKQALEDRLHDLDNKHLVDKAVADARSADAAAQRAQRAPASRAGPDPGS